MTPSRKWVFLILVLVAVCLVPIQHVQAYIDPGTGGYLLQIILAALFGALFTLKVCWKKIKETMIRARSLLYKNKQGPSEQ